MGRERGEGRISRGSAVVWVRARLSQPRAPGRERGDGASVGGQETGAATATVRERSPGAPKRAAGKAPAGERQSRPPAAAHNSSPPSMEGAAGRRVRLPPPPPPAAPLPDRAASCRRLAWLVPSRLRDGVRLTHGMAESRSHGRGLRIAPLPPSPEPSGAGRCGARLPPLAAPRGLAAGGGGRQLPLFIYLSPHKKWTR